MGSWRDSVLHWKRKLEKGVPDEKVLEILSKLQRVPITVELLQETGIGKVVNSLRKYDGEIAKKAVKVVSEWKHAVCGNDKPVKPSKYTCNGEQQQASYVPENKYLSKNSHSSQKPEKYTVEEDSYDPSSSTDDYRNFKQTDSGVYNPNSTQQDYRKFLLQYQDSGSSSTNGDSRDGKYTKHGHSDYRCQDSDDERGEEVETYDRHSFSATKHSLEQEDLSDSEPPPPKKVSKQSSPVKKKSHEKEAVQSSSCSKTKDKVKSHETVKSVSVVHKEIKSEKSSHRKSEKHKSEEKVAKGTKPKKKDASVKSSTEGFNSSIASFEDCLGFNDSVVPAVKTKAKSSSSSKGGSNSTNSVPSQKQKKVEDKQSSRKSSKEHSERRETSRSSHKSSKHRRKEDEIPEPLKKPKLKQLDPVDILSTLPEIQPDYKPMRVRMPDSPPPKKKVTMSNEEAIAYTSSRKEKTAVYAGRRHNVYTEVLTLFNSCVRVLIENIDGIGFTGGVPYDVLKPILEKCTPAQLYVFEDNNNYLLDDTNELWEVHLKRDFKGKLPDETETWRDLYLRLYDEREAKLKMITANISASQAKATPVRQTKLAYVDTIAKPPRNVARRQAKYGTGLPVSHPVKAGPPSQATPRPTAPVINAANVVAASSSSQASQKKQVIKVAPLMQKTLKFMKQRFRR